jgi:hypothetical protein
MYLPRQSEPVQRTLVARPFVSRGDGSASELAEVTEQALRAGESGVQPSGINWGQIASTALPILASLF